MNANNLAMVLVVGLLLFVAPAAADGEPAGQEAEVPCTPVFVTTYDPYVTVYWHCIPDLPIP